MSSQIDACLERIGRRIRELEKRQHRLRKKRRSVSRRARKMQSTILDIVTVSCGNAETQLRNSNVLVPFSRAKRKLAHLDASLGTIHTRLRELYAQADERLTVLYDL
jgi:hypothetical protein